MCFRRHDRHGVYLHCLRGSRNHVPHIDAVALLERSQTTGGLSLSKFKAHLKDDYFKNAVNV